MIEKLRDIVDNLKAAHEATDGLEELMESASKGDDPDLYWEIADRLLEFADAKDGDWFTRTFTSSTPDEMRCLAKAYLDMAHAAEEEADRA